MNTPAHMVLAAALLARPGEGRAANLAAVAGGFAPDASLYAMVAWQGLVAGRSHDEIFREDYFSTAWQTVFAIDNSAIVWAGIALAAALLSLRWATVFGLAALLHIAADLPLHNNDGRPHFWPLTDWVFRSPVSYWDPRHFGGVVGPVELALVLVLGVLLWRRFPGAGARALIVAGVVAEAAAGHVWSLVFH